MEYSERFERFWEVYPRKVGKFEASKAFEKLNEDDQQQAVADVRRRSQRNWWSSTPKLIAHASTYLNQRRFEDEWQADLEVRYEAVPVAPRRRMEENPGAGHDNWGRGANRIALQWLRKGHVKEIEPLVKIKNDTLAEMRTALAEETEAGRGREASLLLAEMILSRLDLHYGTTRKNGIMASVARAG